KKIIESKEFLLETKINLLQLYEEDIIPILRHAGDILEKGKYDKSIEEIATATQKIQSELKEKKEQATGVLLGMIGQSHEPRPAPIIEIGQKTLQIRQEVQKKITDLLAKFANDSLLTQINKKLQVAAELQGDDLQISLAKLKSVLSSINEAYR